MKLEDLRLLGGKRCIDFANSYDNVAPGERVDFIESYDDLLRWSSHVDLASDAEIATLHALASDNEPAAQAVYQRASDLRSALRSIFRAIATGGGFDEAALEVLQQEYRQTVAGLRLASRNGGIDWDWSQERPGLDQPLRPIVLSAIELLIRGETSRIKLCASHNCGWLFYDNSKNRSRRWCSMEGCGSQSKMRRFYRRQKQKSERA